MNHASPLELSRLRYQPPLPRILLSLEHLGLRASSPSELKEGCESIKQLFPRTYNQGPILFAAGEPEAKSARLRVGVVLSGGQAPGGHNVIAGLYDALKELHPGSTLLGFRGGPAGILKNETIEITAALIDNYRNLGGFDMIGSGRTKIEGQEQLLASLATADRCALDGLVIIGGDDSNTNAAHLAEFFLSAGSKTRIVGVPKTIDGDLKSREIEISFGHDTACKVYNELIGNLMRDALSARKYYHFVKLMGRSASHIALECALKTHPNLVLIGEEIAAAKTILDGLTHQIATLITERSAAGKEFGVILIPEGLIEFLPEIGSLIRELNTLLAREEIRTEVDRLSHIDERISVLCGHLSPDSALCFARLPYTTQAELLFERDPHGNVQVSKIATEQLLIATVTHELAKRAAAGIYRGSFHPVHHFFGYEGRSAMPSQFDCQYTYALGYTSALLINAHLTGYMATIHNLTQPCDVWQVGGTPITALMQMEERKGKRVPVVKKALVDLQGPAFKTLVRNRARWAKDDLFGYPGPIQFTGPQEVVGELPLTLILESQGAGTIA